MKTKPSAMLALLLLAGAFPANARRLAAFAIGRGPKAMPEAVEVQQQARSLISTSGNWELVNVEEVVQPGGMPEKEKTLAEGLQLLKEGRAAYEQLDLETAVASFSGALARFEAGYAVLHDQSPLIECLIFLGAANVLMGDSSQAKEYFGRALDFPGDKKLDTNLFPPNIQEIFEQARKEVASGVGGGAYLISEPLGAALFVEGSFRGGTPATLEDLRPGMHLGRVEKDGYLPWGGRLKIVAGTKRNLRVTLKPAEKTAEFSQHFRSMSAEVAKGTAGEGTRSLRSFLGAETLLIVMLEGGETAMKMTGFVVRDIATTRERTFDTTGQDYPEQLKGFLLELINLGAAPAAAVAAASGEDGAELGLDLSDQGQSETEGAGAETAEQGEAVAAAAPAGEGTESKGEEAAEKQVELEAAAALAAPLVEDKNAPPPVEPTTSFWHGITGRWWFWTAVGVLAAGAAAGTYFLASPSSSGGGGLVIQIH